MHLLRPLRAPGLLLLGVAATLALWVAASPPATSTLAPTPAPSLAPAGTGRA